MNYVWKNPHMTDTPIEPDKNWFLAGTREHAILSIFSIDLFSGQLDMIKDSFKIFSVLFFSNCSRLPLAMFKTVKIATTKAKTNNK